MKSINSSGWQRAVGVTVFALSPALLVPVLAQVSAAGCGGLANGYGPFDYRTSRAELAVVEKHHFTLQVEQLRAGQEGYIGGDLDYTLRASPNHHRALLSMMRYGEQQKSAQVQAANYPVECYFERAIRFRPDDTTARMLYVTYLQKNNRKPEALRQLTEVTRLATDNGFTHYNAGLLYLDMQEYDLALERAHAAMTHGFERPQLKERLAAAGRWRDPATASAAAADTAASVPR